MLQAIVVAISSALGLATIQHNGPAFIPMPELTVPASRLAPGCTLAPRSTSTDDGIIRPGNWAGLTIPRNPWTGTEQPLIATIRQRMGGSSLLPDGPPLTVRQEAEYRLQLAEGVEEGYAAIYSPADTSGSAVIVVYALRFSEGVTPLDAGGRAHESRNPRIMRVTLGRTVAVVHGDDGPCFQGIASHLRSLAK
jgi:hypothetical protein